MAKLTSFELGGAAEYFARVEDEASLLEGLRWARERELPVTLLGGGSNVVVSDRGVAGLVLQIGTRGVSMSAEHEGVVQVRACAGESWDALVARCVALELAGIECLSGIPGSVGATPIQNVGAYGQEVADTLCSVEVLERDTLQRRVIGAEHCGFGYRTSLWKRQPDRHVVLAVTFALRARAEPSLRYAELAQALAAVPGKPSLAQVRAAVLELRRKKSMLLDPLDENRRSAGSFFTNPIVSAQLAEQVVARALQQRLVPRAQDVPRYPQADGTVKLAAGWLIERADIAKGMRQGHFGVSSRHALALVHHGGGTSAELLQLAQVVALRVKQSFGVDLSLEPVLLGEHANPPPTEHAADAR